ncbi:MAG TPA: EsaB/YukD family protein [Actinomycetota bacterium]|nr:EsaB/YukD family protein [Actinomycetota bacterium]
MSTISITVVGPADSKAVDLPSDAPLNKLLPDLVELVGPAPADRTNGEPTMWSLAPASGLPLPPASSLRSSGILEGATLYLSPWRQKDPKPSPVPDAHKLSPPQRTRAVLPERMSFVRRLGATFRAAIELPAPEQPSPLYDFTHAEPNGYEAKEPALPVAGPTPASLTKLRTPPASQRARRKWRATNYLERLDEAIATPRLKRCVTIAVVSPKGGVGKTTTTALLGTLLALLRRDRVVAIDTNPDYGSLGRVLAPGQTICVDDVLQQFGSAEAGSLDPIGNSRLSLTELDAQLGRAPHGLMVLPAPSDPSRMQKLDYDSYVEIIKRLKDFVGVVVLDCGTGLQDAAARAAMTTCDQLVLVTDAEPAAASLVAEAAVLLGKARKPITLVVNKMPQSGSSLDLERFCRFVPHAQGMCVLPNEPVAAARLATAEFSWRDAPDSLQRACRELAVALIADWPRLGLTL